MKQCSRCYSMAINHNLHGRDGSDRDLCDVCYWRKRAESVEGINPNELQHLLKIETALENLIDSCRKNTSMAYEPEVLAAEAALGRLYLFRKEQTED